MTAANGADGSWPRTDASCWDASMRRTLATTAAVLLTLVLAGCGDDDSDTPAAAPETASTQPA